MIGNPVSLDTMVLIYPTTLKLKRICMPSDAMLKMFNIGSKVNPAILETYFSDVKTCWYVILITVGVALIISYIYMIVVRYCAGVFVWLTIFAYLALLILLAYWCWSKGEENISKGENGNKNMLYIGYVVAAFAAINVIIVCCLCSKINLAIAILKTASMFIREVKSVLFVPVIIFLVSIGFYAFWIIGFLYLYSIGDFT